VVLNLNYFDDILPDHNQKRQPKVSHLIRKKTTTIQPSSQEFTMRKSSLRRTTLLSLIGLSPRFTTAQATTSTDNLIPRQDTTSWGEAFTVENSAVSTPDSSLPTSEQAAPTVITGSNGASASDVTVVTGIQSLTTTAGAATTQSEAGAEGKSGFRKMGFAGVVAGAAGVLFV
jgi:hypothetical protein